MNQPLRTSSTATLAVLASVLAGCATPQSGRAVNFGGKVADTGYATRALDALTANKIPQAIALAEQAVAKTPNDAGFRAILGNAYFAGGRFRSAEAAYRDALSLYPNQPQVVLKLALVQIALGQPERAVASLKTAREALGDSNYGLALALAGHRSEAISVLEPLARSTSADATVRQNLALAYAFAGNWDNARAIAGQDLPADQLEVRIRQWMQLASPKAASDQVAALVGVTPAAVDAGLPVKLALNRTPDTEYAQADPVAVEPPSPPVVQAVATLHTPAPVVEATASVPPAPPPARPTVATMAANVVSEAKAVLASLTTPHPVAAVKAKPRAVAVASPRRGNSPAVVQLGAYGSPNRVLAAWNGTAAKYGALKAYLPMSAKFASPKGVFYRLSVRGFASDAEARNLCMSLRRQGGSCFVRNTAGDQPVQYASR